MLTNQCNSQMDLESFQTSSLDIEPTTKSASILVNHGIEREKIITIH